MKFLIRNGGVKTKAHIWIETDTACTMHSTGGLSSNKGYRVTETSEGRQICTMCQANFKKLQQGSNSKNL